MQARYRHRQIGTLLIVVLGFGIVLTGVGLTMTTQASERAVIGFVLAVLLICLLLFHSLTVEVNEEELIVSFGPGLIRKRFRIEDITDAREVRNKWYYGWGIRLTPHGWMFNVSGLDGVELELKGGRRFRVGTDEPQKLLASIRAISRRRSAPLS